MGCGVWAKSRNARKPGSAATPQPLSSERLRRPRAPQPLTESVLSAQCGGSLSSRASRACTIESSRALSTLRTTRRFILLYNISQYTTPPDKAVYGGTPVARYISENFRYLVRISLSNNRTIETCTLQIRTESRNTVGTVGVLLRKHLSNVGVQARVPLGVPLRRGVDSVGHEALVDAPSAVDESSAAVDEADFELRRGALDEHL